MSGRGSRVHGAGQVRRKGKVRRMDCSGRRCRCGVGVGGDWGMKVRGQAPWRYVGYKIHVDINYDVTALCRATIFPRRWSEEEKETKLDKNN